MLERLTDGMAVITPAIALDVVLASLAPMRRRVSAIVMHVLTQGSSCIRRRRLVSGPGIAVTCHRHRVSVPTHYRCAPRRARGLVTATSQRKIDTALELMTAATWTSSVQLALTIPNPIGHTPTPMSAAAAAHLTSRIVLPEGGRRSHPQIGARRFLCGIVDLTILADSFCSLVCGQRTLSGPGRRQPVVTSHAQVESTDQFADQYAQFACKAKESPWSMPAKS